MLHYLQQLVANCSCICLAPFLEWVFRALSLKTPECEPWEQWEWSEVAAPYGRGGLQTRGGTSVGSPLPATPFTLHTVIWASVNINMLIGAALRAVMYEDHLLAGVTCQGCGTTSCGWRGEDNLRPAAQRKSRAPRGGNKLLSPPARSALARGSQIQYEY